MAIKRRTSADAKIVCRFDSALAHIGEKKVNEYIRTLDAECLGDLSNIAEKPSVFTVRPLMSDKEYLENGEHSDWWSIFACHVKEITEFDLSMTRTDGVIDFKYKDEIPPRVVKDIAQQIISLANHSGDSVFTLPPDGFSAFLRGAIAARISEASKTTARLEAAKNKKPESDETPSDNTESTKNSESK
jgi:hypothetical protein